MADEKPAATKDEKEEGFFERFFGDMPTLILAVGVALLIRTFLFQSFYVPSDSMFPTMLVGDHVFVNKLVYGLKVPFTDKRVLPFREPKRGEVIVFQLGRGPRGELRPSDLWPDFRQDAFVKRLIAVPGDRVAVEQGRIRLNGELLPVEATGEIFTDGSGNEFDIQIETLGECKHRILDLQGKPDLDMAEIEIKPGRYFFMGDNRDNSHDGRLFGTVRVQEMEGPAGLLYWSWDWAGGWLELLNPLTWIDNLANHTRWSRMGRFRECFDPLSPPAQLTAFKRGLSRG